MFSIPTLSILSFLICTYVWPIVLYSIISKSEYPRNKKYIHIMLFLQKSCLCQFVISHLKEERLRESARPTFPFFFFFAYTLYHTKCKNVMEIKICNTWCGHTPSSSINSVNLSSWETKTDWHCKAMCCVTIRLLYCSW